MYILFLQLYKKFDVDIKKKKKFLLYNTEYVIYWITFISKCIFNVII